MDFRLPDRALKLLRPLHESLDRLAEDLRPEVAFDYGIALLAGWQPEQAETVLRDAIGKYAEHDRVWQGRLALGLALADLEKLAEAREEWQAVVNDAPDSPFADRAEQLIEQVGQMLERQ